VLSRRAQVGRLQRLASRAVEAYPLEDPHLRFITHGENTTFRVNAAVPDSRSGEREQFLLRVHRPGRHGREVDPAVAIRSELQWLAALRAHTDLLVPEPVANRTGELVTVISSPGVDEPRACSLLRWMDGQIRTNSAKPVHLERLGSAMARLHNHADQWLVPHDFVRIRWDWETFFGNTMSYGGIDAADVWDLLPDDLRRAFDWVASEMGELMANLGDGPETFGLIHADLHLDNTLFLGGEARLIDFDDCGFGYRIYEIAVALWELRDHPDYEAFRSALVAGYTQHRPLPSPDLAHLDAFIATRHVAFGLWYVGTAQVNPAFRDRLDRTLGWVGRSLDALQSA
jgi:Ser/Thr protein kinase RdoA (MazF antagonist)